MYNLLFVKDHSKIDKPSSFLLWSIDLGLFQKRTLTKLSLFILDGFISYILFIIEIPQGSSNYFKIGNPFGKLEFVWSKSFISWIVKRNG